MKAKSIVSDLHFKRSIRNIVNAYRTQHAEEYKLLCDAIAMQRKVLSDPTYGEAKASDMRGLYEISVTLQEALIEHLSEDATVWLKSKEGGRWFAKEFKEFALPRAI